MKCGIWPTSELCDSLCRHVLLSIDDFTTTDVALFVWSASKLKMRMRKSLEAALLQKIVELAPHFNPIDVSNILVGLAWLSDSTRSRSSRSGGASRRVQGDQAQGSDYDPSWDAKSTLFQRAVGALEAKLGEGCAAGLNGQGTANVAWALARIRGLSNAPKAGAATPARAWSDRGLLALLRRARKTVPEMSPPGLVMMLGAVPPLVSSAMRRRAHVGEMSDDDAEARKMAELQEHVLRAVRDRSLETVRRFDPHAIAHFLWLITQRRYALPAFVSDKNSEASTWTHRNGSERYSEEGWEHWEESQVDGGGFEYAEPRGVAFCDDEMKDVLLDHAAQVNVGDIFCKSCMCV